MLTHKEHRRLDAIRDALVALRRDNGEEVYKSDTWQSLMTEKYELLMKRSVL